MWGAIPVLWGKTIALNAYTRKEKMSQINNLSNYFKKTRERRAEKTLNKYNKHISRNNEITLKIEISEIKDGYLKKIYQ